MTTQQDHEHCWHGWRGPYMAVLPNGHVRQYCCKCEAVRNVHADHAFDHANRVYDSSYEKAQTAKWVRWP